MVRCVHFQLAAVVEAGLAMVVAAPVVFGVRGLPKADGGEWRLPVGAFVLGSLFALLAVSTRSGWLGGGRRDFESVVPLTDLEAVLPGTCESMRRSFDVIFVANVALFSLVIGLFYDAWAVGWAVILVPERIVKGVYAFFWERRHGALLWRGRVEEQPLGKGQFLYSSPRVLAPG
ncbi:hypothetical protein ABT275_35440 [Streptomyces sp. NPDC001185]|uniref:hypothetical protein n=1 Tax=Streptomyces sp. NPDC001185 TaxID=3154380 RepID=UPI0033171167